MTTEERSSLSAEQERNNALLQYFLLAGNRNSLSVADLEKVPMAQKTPLLEKLHMTNDMLISLEKEWLYIQQSLVEFGDRMQKENLLLPSTLSGEQWQVEKQNMVMELLSLTVKRHHPENPNAPEYLPNEPVIYIHVSANRMVAWLMALPPIYGDATLEENQITHALHQHSIRAGIKTELFPSICAMSPPYQLYPVAIGTLPGISTDGYRIDHYPNAPEPNDGSTEIKDYLEHYLRKKYIQAVKKGDVIREVAPPIQGPDGNDVHGNPIPAPPGKNIFLKPTQNTYIEKDGSVLIAATDGHLFYEDHRFHVRPFYSVKEDVQPNSHIEFAGDIYITGNVMENSVIQASGSILIGGIVEGAVMEAGEDIIIDKGVLGNDQALLRAKGSIQTKYLENCVVYSGTEVKSDCIINSNIYSDSDILVTSGRGTIIGGSLTAAWEVHAKVIGSKAEPPTEICLGEYTGKKEELMEATQQLEEVRAELEQENQKLELLEKQESTPELIKKIGKCRLRRATLGMKEQTLRTKQESLTKYENNYSNGRLFADRVYPGLTIRISAAKYTLKTEASPCHAYLFGNQKIIIST